MIFGNKFFLYTVVIGFAFRAVEPTIESQAKRQKIERVTTDLLHKAMFEGQVREVKYLLLEQPNLVNSLDALRDTPLSALVRFLAIFY
ncbi:MAG TPA: hypothetical protein VHA52_05455 [Candidatus Babeliaceae bacterium]|nr:hypothetical protein [Candidatus Babeliaceae bacterium]